MTDLPVMPWSVYRPDLGEVELSVEFSHYSPPEPETGAGATVEFDTAYTLDGKSFKLTAEERDKACSEFAEGMAEKAMQCERVERAP